LKKVKKILKSFVPVDHFIRVKSDKIFNLLGQILKDNSGYYLIPFDWNGKISMLVRMQLN